MKKWMIPVLTIILLLAGCAGQGAGGEAAVSRNKWGVALTAENVTPVSLSLVCDHSGGENVAELNTGSYYVIQQKDGDDWKDLPGQEGIMWTMEAWVIQKNTVTRWDVRWDWLGELPAGEYRIGKKIMNFRGTGDYDEEMVYAEFAIP